MIDTIIYIFASIGVLATAIALYYFVTDQYAIWEIQTLKLVNREIQFKKFLYLVEETKQEAIEESGLSKKEFLKQVSNG